MQHLYFVRHGLSVMNQQGIWSGRSDTPLADQGVQQAIAAGQELRGASIGLIISSPMKRAADTAKLIANEIGYDPANIVVSELFVERDFGPLEGTPYRPNDVLLNETDGVEHSDDLIERVGRGLEFLHSQDAETILVVSHGAVGRVLRGLTEETTSFHAGPKFGNAEVVKLL